MGTTVEDIHTAKMFGRLLARGMSTSARRMAAKEQFSPLQVAIREQETNRKFYPDKHFEILMGLFGVFTAFGLYLNMKCPEMREKCNWSPMQEAFLPKHKNINN